MKPVRIQLRRVKDWKMPDNTVKVDRSTRWGNPWTIGDCQTATEAVRRFRSAVVGFDSGGSFCKPNAAPDSYIGQIIRDVRELRGKNLACWCGLDQPCHADVLIDIANASDSDEVGQSDGPNKAPSQATET